MSQTGATKPSSEQASHKEAVRPFQVNIPEEELTDLRRRIKAARWPERETVDDDTQGVQLDTIKKLAEYWAKDYDWGKCEAKLKALPHFVTEIDGLEIHFIHDLRHTAITRMLEKGISPPLVMKISGHSQQKTFLRYVNQTESSIYDIAMKLDRAGFDQGKPDLRVAMAF